MVKLLILLPQLFYHLTTVSCVGISPMLVTRETSHVLLACVSDVFFVVFFFVCVCVCVVVFARRGGAQIFPHLLIALSHICEIIMKGM